MLQPAACRSLSNWRRSRRVEKVAMVTHSNDASRPSASELQRERRRLRRELLRRILDRETRRRRSRAGAR